MNKTKKNVTNKGELKQKGKIFIRELYIYQPVKSGSNLDCDALVIVLWYGIHSVLDGAKLSVAVK